MATLSQHHHANNSKLKNGHHPPKSKGLIWRDFEGLIWSSHKIVKNMRTAEVRGGMAKK
jgi:hypothetical protein